MNDFTKEELIAIRNNLSFAYTPEENDLLYEAYRKIQYMIDNYCEHNNDPRFNAIPCAGAPKLCTKCNGFYL